MESKSERSHAALLKRLVRTRLATDSLSALHRTHLHFRNMHRVNIRATTWVVLSGRLTPRIRHMLRLIVILGHTRVAPSRIVVISIR
jgi:hypothetical protein